MFLKKKCYHLSFPILEGRNLTRALQSSPFQIFRGVSTSVTEEDGGEGRTEEILESKQCL